MRGLIIIMAVLLWGGTSKAQNLATCKEAWCFDKDGNAIKEFQFDPHSIKWPKHFTGETVKDPNWINVRYKYHDQIDLVSLKEYRDIIGDQKYCEDGVDLHEPFSCEYGNSGRPTYVKASCSLVGLSHEVREIKLGVGSCFKKIIDWTVIDWCTYDPKTDSRPDHDDLFLVKDLVNGYEYYAFNNQYGKLDRDGAYHYQQVIKVGDTEQPVILHSDKMHLDVGGSCEVKNMVFGNKAKDVGECPSENFKWTVTLYEEGKKPEVLDHTIIGKDSVEVKIESLPIGKFQLLWRVNDGCNNPQEEKQIIYVDDNKAPNIICKGSFSVGVGSPGHPIQVWASDFVKSVTDNCTLDSDIIISFAKDSVATSLDLTCESHLGEVDIPIYATDAVGNQSYCLVKSKFSSIDPECKRDLNIAGILSDKDGNPLTNKNLKLELDNGEVYMITTDNIGQFKIQKEIPISAFGSIILANELVQGKVSTFDLVAIQKHVLGQEMITDMYDMASADISGDGVIDQEDVKIMRGYLLGITSFSEVLGNRLVDIESGICAKAIELNDDISSLKLAVIVAGDVTD